jgi:glutamate/tyrosine decarboxylase-like PLP-dependent enzyme
MTRDAGLANRLARLREAARPLEPDAAQRAELLQAVAGYAESFLAGLDSAPAYSPNPDNAAGLLDSPPQEEPGAVDEALELIARHLERDGLNPASGRFMGYIPGGGLHHSALGDYLAAVLNRYAGIFFVCPGAARMENMLVRLLGREMGYPGNAAGTLTSGGSLANLTALAAARDAHGITGAAVDSAAIYMTGQAHHCLDKALKVLGLAGCVRREVPMDERLRMDPAALERMVREDAAAGLRPWCAAATAGTTAAGAVDPLEAVADVCERRGLWMHVDGAYGSLFALCQEGRRVLAGQERSDSLVLDPHKGLFLPYGTGAVLLRDGPKLLEAFGADADYLASFLPEQDEHSPADLSPELTRHFRGLRLWLPLKLAGLGAFRAALSEKMLLARRFWEGVREMDGFEAGPEPQLSVATFRYLPKRGDADAFNERLMQEVNREGRTFVSSARINGKLMLRAAILCFRTHQEHVDEALAALGEGAERMNIR